MLARDCRAPGRYNLDFTVGHHKRKIETAVITRIETIRCVEVGKRP